MYKNLTLRDRIFLISSILILAAVALIWIFVLPRYQEAVVKERTTIVSQLQEYTLRQTDNTFRIWLNSILRLSEDLAQNPAQTAEIVNKAINYTPGLMRVLISDTQSDQTVNVVKAQYSEVDFTINEVSWYSSRINPSINTAWHHAPNRSVDFFLADRAFQIGDNIFRVTMYFNAQRLRENLITIPLGGEYEANILSASGENIINDATFDFPKELIGEASFSNEKEVPLNGKNWYILSSRFETIPFWHLIAIEETFILEPVQQLKIFSLATAGAVLLFMLVFSWYVSRRINRPIEQLLDDIDYLAKLEFDHKIKAVALPEFQPMHDTLENIRETLKRYQKLNVEKIILEEWKNKYMVTYSEDLVAIIDNNNQFSFLNNQFISLLENLKLNPNNTTLKDVLGHTDIKVEKSSQSIHYPDPFTIKVDQAQLTHISDTGVNYYYDYQYLSIIDEDGKQIGAYVIIHDKTQDRLLDIKRNDMINVIVHELKNPITGVVGLSKLIMDSDSMSMEESKVLISEVFNSGERMNELVNRFLEVQKLEAGNTSIDISNVNMLNIVKEVRSLTKPLLTSKELTTKVNTTGNDFVFEGDKDLVFDAVQNLLSNAIKYGDPGREIEFDIVAEEEQISIGVMDHGFGISVEDQNKVFDKFFRVKSNLKAANEKGTGLGLAYVKEIMQRHDGDIQLESTPEIGSKFTLIFPRIHSKN